MLLLALADAYIPDRAIVCHCYYFYIFVNLFLLNMTREKNLLTKLKQDIPLKFKNLLSIPDKISHIALLGNSTGSSEFLKFLAQVSSNISIVRGEFDSPRIEIPNPRRINIDSKNTDKSFDKNNERNENNLKELPLTSIIKVGNFKIGCCSGYTVVPKNDPVSLLILARQLDVDILLWGGTHNVEAYTLDGKFFINPGSCTGAFNSDWPVNNNTFDQLDVAQEVRDNETKQVNDVKIEESKKEEEAITNSIMSSSNNQVNKKEEDIDILDSIITGSNTPSFCLLDVQDSICTLYIYLYIDGDVRVDKVVFQKDREAEERSNKYIG